MTALNKQALIAKIKKQTESFDTVVLKEDEANLLLNELEVAERERDNWRTSFDNERFRADKLAKAFKTEHEQLLMANGALITQHMKANGAERRIAELESNPIATLDVQSERADGNKFALVYSSAAHKLPDDVYYLCVAASAGIGAKGE